MRDDTIAGFLDQLAARVPAPGGGATAALHAAAAGAGKGTAGPYLYWANLTGVTVGRAWLDGSHVNNRFITGGVDPERLHGVAIAGRYLYWGVDVPTNGPAIGRARLDGTGVNQRFITGISAPAGVAVDGRHIYWSDPGSSTIGEANHDGTEDRKSVV